MRVNEFSETIELAVIELNYLLVPQLSESDKKLTRSFDDIESYVKSDNNILMSILKYSFLIRYLSNNQILVFGSLMNLSLPINFHVATQALTSGLKPKTEQY